MRVCAEIPNTLYSLRHSWATLELLHSEVDIYALPKQMGNSAAMIEQALQQDDGNGGAVGLTLGL